MKMLRRKKLALRAIRGTGEHSLANKWAGGSSGKAAVTRSFPSRHQTDGARYLAFFFARALLVLLASPF